MTHDSYRELIQRELDDDLSPEEMVVLEAHLTTCADCRREREEYKSIAFGLSRLSKVMPESSFVSQITPDILEHAQLTPQAPAKKVRRIAPTWWRGLSVAAVVVLAIGFATNWHFGQKPNHPSTTEVAQATDQKPTQQPPASDRPISTTQTQPATPPVTQRVADATKQVEQRATLEKPAPVTVSKVASSQAGTTVKPIGTVRVADAGPLTGNTLKPASGIGVVPSPDTNGTAAKTLHPTSDTINPTDTDEGGIVSPAGIQTLGASAQKIINIGSTPAFPNVINSQLQQQVNSGVASAAWATDSFEVVKHFLNELGFAPTSTEVTTIDSSRVHVLQNGVLYEVKLVQPFDTGEKGIWRPARIGRAINDSNPNGYEQTILTYFDDQVTQGTLLSHQEVFVISNLENSMLSVTVNEESAMPDGEHTWADVQYNLTLDQDTNGTWSIKNAERVQ